MIQIWGQSVRFNTINKTRIQLKKGGFSGLEIHETSEEYEPDPPA